MMAKIDLIKSCVQSLQQISNELSNALVYLDAGTAEAFQFTGGISPLLELGACAVCSLEQATSLDIVVNWQGASEESVHKLVVITSQLLSHAHRYILRCLKIHRSVRQCTIFTTVSENAHAVHVDAPLGPDAYREYETLLLQDYQELLLKHDSKVKTRTKDNEEQIQSLQKSEEALENDNLEWRSEWEEHSFSPEVSSSNKSSDEFFTMEEKLINLMVSVQHFPMVLCPLTSHAFVLPSESAVAKARLSDKFENSLCPGLPPICKLPSDGEDVPGATLTAHFLHHLANQMDLKLEIFSLGPLSNVIGNLLTHLSSLYDVGGRNKRNTGLLIIDRSLDLITPCCHGDSLIDRMLVTLPGQKSNIHQHLSENLSMNRANLSYLQRSSVDVRVPLENIVKTDNFDLKGANFPIKSVCAFLSEFKSIGDDVKNSNLIEDTVGKVDSLYSSISSSGYFNDLHCLEALIERRSKDGLLLIKKWLQDALRQEKVSFRNRPGAVTPAMLRHLLDALSSKPELLMKYGGIIQLAKAAEEALSEPSGTRWEAFVSAERILMLGAGDTSQSLSGQIQDLINQTVIWRSQNQGKSDEPPPGLLTVRDAMILAIAGYCLAGESFGSAGSGGPFSWEEEHALKEATIDAIFDCNPGVNISFLHGLEASLESHWQRQRTSNVDAAEPAPSGDGNVDSIDFDDQWGSWDDDEVTDKEPEYGELQLKLELRDRIDSVFKIFHKVSNARRILPFKDKLYVLDEMSGPTLTSRGLIPRILSMIFSKCDIPGLEYHSSTVGRLLKSGFGRFGLRQAKPKLEDQSVLFVFVVGGINTTEIREAQEVHSLAGVNGELLMGGTTLLTPDDMFELLLGSSSYI